jgi:2-methylcitrate dehydratase PrpD
LPFTTAVALTRDMTNPLVYNEEAVWDPVVRDLAKRVELIPVEAMAQAGTDRFQAELCIEAAGHQYTLTTQPHKGSPRHPFTWEEICDKFCRFTAQIIDTAQATAIMEAVADLEHAKDLAIVARHLVLV